MIRGLRVPINLTSRESLRMLHLADIWATRTGEEVRLVSANDHVHSRGSAHYAGLALDFQSSNAEALATMFRLAGFRVLWNVPGHHGHVHVQYDGLGDMQDERNTTKAATGAATPRSRVRVGG